MATPRIVLVVAVNQKNGIGSGGKIPWDIPEDKQFVKELTTKVSNKEMINACVMGSKTYLSIPPLFRPLSNRINIVLTNQNETDLPLEEGVIRKNSMLEVMRYIDDNDKIETIFVFGGENVYSQFMKHDFVDKAYVTRVDNEMECDTFFHPTFPKEKYTKEVQPLCICKKNNTAYWIEEYTKIKKEPETQPQGIRLTQDFKI
jgi:dihydrofolate reductase